jgi:hypothetical protein
VFAAVGAWALVSPDGPYRLDLWGIRFAEAFVVAGLLIGAAVLLVRRTDCVTLGPDDFETTALFRSVRFRWADVSTFSVWTYSRRKQQMVLFDDPTKRGRWGALNPAYSGHNCYIPDTYGLTGHALAELMNRWRAQALAAQGARGDAKQPAPSADRASR